MGRDYQQDRELKGGEYRLIRLRAANSNSGVGKGIASGAMHIEEVVALLSFNKKLTLRKHAFCLRSLGSELAGEMGNLWTLMVAVTALRL